MNGPNGILDIWLGRRSHDDERQIITQKGIASRFRNELLKMIKNGGRKLIIILFFLRLDRFYCIGAIN